MVYMVLEILIHFSCFFFGKFYNHTFLELGNHTDYNAFVDCLAFPFLHLSYGTITDTITCPQVLPHEPLTSTKGEMFLSVHVRSRIDMKIVESMDHKSFAMKMHAKK